MSNCIQLYNINDKVILKNGIVGIIENIVPSFGGWIYCIRIDTDSFGNYDVCFNDDIRDKCAPS